jgi:hypothetical protein
MYAICLMTLYIAFCVMGLLLAFDIQDIFIASDLLIIKCITFFSARYFSIR